MATGGFSTLSLHDALPISIAAMGSKTEAKAMMAAAGVPTLPGVTIDADTDLAAEAARIGFPVLVKRSEEHTSELQSHSELVCRLLLEKKKRRVICWCRCHC